MISSVLAALMQRGFGAFASGFSWYQLVPGWSGEYSYGWSLGMKHPAEFMFVPATWTVVALILVLALFARRGLEAALARPGTDKYLPDNTLTARNVAEMFIAYVWSMVEASLGAKEGKNFFPLVCSLFMYILVANLTGFIPGWLPPTDNFSSNFALAAVTFCTFVGAGLFKDAKGFLAHLWGPIWWLGVLLFPLEVISLIIRPMSLTIRLTVNIFVDHMLSTIARDIGGMIPFIGAALAPVPLYFLGLLVCVIQAFVFALLTTIYLSLSLPHPTDGHGHH